MPLDRMISAPSYAEKLLADVPIFKAACVVLGAIVGYVAPSESARQAAMAAFALLLLDTLTGVVAAWYKRVPISSARFSRVLVKIVGYGAVLLVSSVVAHTIPGATEYQSAGVVGVLTLVIATESISILENVERMDITLPFGLNNFLKKRFGADVGDTAGSDQQIKDKP